MSTSLAPLLSRKLKKVLETRTDSPDLLASLSALSTFYEENTLQSRRNLRVTLERRGLSINQDFLAASEAAQKALDAVDSEVQDLADCCERISKALSSCTASTGDMVVATEQLKEELEKYTRRQELVSNFLHNYQLTPAEITALREEDLDERFFKALARVQEIHANCKVLLRTHHQRAGLELMDVMAVYQDGAYDRLCRWVQAECRSLGDNDTPEVSDLLRTAAHSLKERPVLFKYCAEEVSNTRHNALFRRFISALTRGGPGGMPRPIEVHAHDPLRYVGDMLAWLHQALASERELAMALFSGEQEDGGNNTSRRFSRDAEANGGDLKAGQIEADMAWVLNRVFEGVCRPFKLRVGQVLDGPPGLILAYNLWNLLAFYTHTISELLGDDAALAVTLHDVCDSAQKTFFDLVKARGDKLLRYPPSVSADLSPPSAVGDSMALLLELLETHKRVMVASGMARPSFEPVLQAMLTPLLQMCERAAASHGSKSAVSNSRRISSSSSTENGVKRVDSLSNGSKGASHSRRAVAADLSSGAGIGSVSPQVVETLRRIFIVNCLSAMQQPLMGYEVASAQTASLGTAIEAHISSLVENEVKDVLEKCSLTAKIAIMSVPRSPSEPPLATREGLRPISLGESLRSLYGLLSGNEGAWPDFELIQMPRLREIAFNKVASELSDSYKTVYTAVMDPVSGYPEPRSMLRHTPDQMRTILGI